MSHPSSITRPIEPRVKRAMNRQVMAFGGIDGFAQRFDIDRNTAKRLLFGRRMPPHGLARELAEAILRMERPSDDDAEDATVLLCFADALDEQAGADHA